MDIQVLQCDKTLVRLHLNTCSACILDEWRLFEWWSLERGTDRLPFETQVGVFGFEG